MPFDRVVQRVIVAPAFPFTSGGEAPAGLHVAIAGAYFAGNTFLRLRLAAADGSIAPAPDGILPAGSILTINGFEYATINDVAFGALAERAAPALAVDVLYERGDPSGMAIDDVQRDSAAGAYTARGLASYLNALPHASVNSHLDNGGAPPSNGSRWSNPPGPLRVDLYPNIGLAGHRRQILGSVGDEISSSGGLPFAAFAPTQAPGERFVERMEVTARIDAPYKSDYANVAIARAAANGSGVITGLSRLYGGARYAAGNYNVASFEGGDGATATAAVGSRGSITTLTVVNGGTGYTDNEIVAIWAASPAPLAPVPIGECVVEIAAALAARIPDGTIVHTGVATAQAALWGAIDFADAADEIVVDADTTRLGVKVTLDLRLPYGTAVSASERLLVDGAVYDIEAVRPSTESGRDVQVTATRIEAAGV